ncbi:hypothetical protein ACTXT7_012361 [Hymenolepis weldensis]
MYLACTTLGLTMEQAITAATINAAYSINLSHRVGAITEGRQGDFVVINTKRWENIIFRLGESQDLIEYVIKKGRIIYAKETGRVCLSNQCRGFVGVVSTVAVNGLGIVVLTAAGVVDVVIGEVVVRYVVVTVVMLAVGAIVVVYTEFDFKIEVIGVYVQTVVRAVLMITIEFVVDHALESLSFLSLTWTSLER